MDIEEKLNEIRRQAKEDFKFIMIAFDNTQNSMNTIVQEIGVIKAKMARQEERFEMMLDVVQLELRRGFDQKVVDDHETRLQALERKINPAA